LVVDDEPLFRETIRGLLGGLSQVRDHVKMIEVDSAETALKVFETREFDYVIADIDMGRAFMNGYEFAQVVLEKYPNTHVLIHSNKRKDELDVQIRQAAGRMKNEGRDAKTPERQYASTKFLGFLPKPMKASELLQFLACKTFEASQQGRQGQQEKKIIVLNDDDCFNIGMKIEMKSHGVQVLDALNVSDAMQHFIGNEIFAIVSDVNLGVGMPSGYDFLTRVREKDKQVPFIFTSGYPKSDVWPRAEKLGANGYLQVPFNDGELKELLKI